MARRCNSVCCVLLVPSCLLAAAVLVALAVILPSTWPGLLRGIVDERMRLLPGNVPFQQLQNPSLPIFKDVYFFNLTNPEEFAAGSPPNVIEIGPYSYNEIRIKFFNESDLSDNDTLLTYTQRKTFHFNESRSALGVSEEDIICTVNLPLLGAVYQAEQIPSDFLRGIAKLYLKETIFKDTDAQLHVCVPATELVFNYTDELIQRLHTDPLLREIGKSLPTDYISLQQNDSINDTYPSIIHTGVDDPDLLGQFEQWDGKQELDVWPGPSANLINGTEGLIFKPNQHEDEQLEVFVDDVLRSFPLEYISSTSILGLPVFRYELPGSVFKNATTNPENARWGSWCPNGLLYIGAVQEPQVPVFASKARFLDADPELTRDKVDNLPPINQSLETVAFIHPLIGATLQFQRVLQLNMQINQTSDYPQLENIDGTIYYPVLYLNEHAELTPEFKSYLEDNGLRELQIASGAIYAFTWIFGILAVVALIVAMIPVVIWCRRRISRAGYTKV